MAIAISNRRIATLAIPALGALAAEPLYVLVDTAVVGHLGVTPLAGLAIAGGLFANTVWLFNFLAYGTTGTAARRFGAGRRAEAVDVGVQATWLALALGLVLCGLVEALAGPATALVAGSGRHATQAAAESWLRIAALGSPAILVSIAGQGWLRGIQDTRRPLLYLIAANAASAAASPALVYGLDLGLDGSAIANVLAQVVAAGCFLRALVREGVPLRPQTAAMRAQLVIGRDLMIRTLAFEVNFLTAAAVASRMGSDRIAAHQIALQLWTFLALVLDSLAIAAQALVGELLGAGDGDRARATARRLAELGAVLGTVFAVVLLAGWTLIPRVFTSDHAVLAQTHVAWPWLAGMQPVAGLLFALDGVLIGAGDVVFMRNATLVASVVGFLPMTLAASALDLGLGGIWAGLTLYVVARTVAGVWRTAGGRWVRLGAA